MDSRGKQSKTLVRSHDNTFSSISRTDCKYLLIQAVTSELVAYSLRAKVHAVDILYTAFCAD